MCRHTKIVCGLALAGVLAVAGSCSRRPPRIYAPTIDAAAAGARAMEMYDANKDGKLSGEELDKCPGLKAGMGGGEVTAEAITARILAWQRSRLGRLPIGCTVLHNGQPLEGAEVKFVPEEFLGEAMQQSAVATGKTDQNGATPLSVGVSGKQFDPEGVPPGLYRVEITKPGLDIPAKYNTQTVLGHEVSYETMIHPIIFDLKF
jgi:hypothetical protein